MARMPGRHTAMRLIAASVLALPLAMPRPASAVDANRVAEGMADRAAHAYEDGDHLRAADLYESAWRLDPGHSPWLYNAGRAAHVAGKLDRAEALYRQFLALPGRDAVFAGKAQDHLQAIVQRRAENLADQAAFATQARNHASAARLYEQAWQLLPTRIAYLLQAARAELLAGERAGAERDFREWLSRAPADAPERSEAETALQPALAVAAEPTPTAPPMSVVAPAEPPAPRWPEWTAVAAGGTLTAIGMGMYLLGSTEEAAYERDLAKTDPSTGWIVGLSHDAANSRADAVQARYVQAAVLGSVGVAALSAGAWLLLRGPQARATLAVAPGGASLAVRF